MIQKVENALKFFYKEINAEDYIELVGSKLSKDLIEFFEVLKMHPTDTQKANLAIVQMRANAYIKKSSRAKFVRIKTELNVAIEAELMTSIVVIDSFVKSRVESGHGNQNHIKHMEFIKMMGGLSNE